MSRKTLKDQKVDVHGLAAESEAEYKLGDKTIDSLAHMAATGNLTLEQLKSVLKGEASLPEVTGKK